MAITQSQCKAARELLGWTRGRLANAAGVSRATIHKGEEDGSSLSTLRPFDPPSSFEAMAEWKSVTAIAA